MRARVSETNASSRRLLLFIGCLLLFAFSASAHVGSPDVFYEGKIGPYPAHVVIRMPTVVPGRAQIFVRADTNTPVEVSFRPLFVYSAVSNAPPADVGRLVPGETNLYSGDLWLMTSGGYSIEVKLRGAAGEGAVEIPVNSVALHQMPMPPFLGTLLAALGILIVIGTVAIIMGAARDSTLAPGEFPDAKQRRKGYIAGSVTAIILLAALAGGAKWWNSDERDFRQRLHESDPPKLKVAQRAEGSQRVLRLDFRKKKGSGNALRLLPDHDKLLHFFLIREPGRDAFAHLHPIRKGGEVFELPLPPLPAGRYAVFCDMTLERSGLSVTATNTIQLLPSITDATFKPASASLDADPDDSWAGAPNATLPSFGAATNASFELPDGLRVIWKPHGPLRARQDAGLQFEVVDATGKPAALEPYMGMMAHAAIMSANGGVFAHLHPAGNYSMAAQNFYEDKLALEAALCAPQNGSPTILPHSAMHLAPSSAASGIISLPYEFPTPGEYRIWVQVKSGGHVSTAVFDTTVGD